MPVHPLYGSGSVLVAARPRQDVRSDRPLIAGLALLHFIELLMLLKAAGVTARDARAHPGHGAGLPTLLVLATMVMVLWQAARLLRGRSLSTVGMVLQAAILMV